VATEPWYEFLALPIAPFVLFLQALAFAARRPIVAAIVGVLGFLAIVAMWLYVLYGVDEPASGGANIGAGLLLMEAVIAGALMAAALIRAKPKGARPF